MKNVLSLNICSAQGVQPKGLGGWIYVMCDNPVCKAVNKISIGKQHKSVSKVDNLFNLTRPGYAIFDVNTKAASGMLHAGIGETHLNNLLCAMNIPRISHKSLKQRGRNWNCYPGLCR